MNKVAPEENRPKEVKMLEKRLKNLKTGKGESCSGFQITLNQEKVRLSLKEIANLGLPENSKDILTYKQAAEIIFLEAEEQGGEVQEMIKQTRRSLEDAKNLLINSINECMRIFQSQLEEISRNAFSSEFREKAQFLVKNVDSKNFDEKVDDFFVKHFKVRETEVPLWGNSATTAIISSVKSFQTKINRKFTEASTKLANLLNKKQNTQCISELDGFEKRNIRKMAGIGDSSHFCLGERSFSVGKDIHNVGIVRADGCLQVCDLSISGFVIQELPNKIHREPLYASSIAFNKTGTKFLVTLTNKRSINEFDASTLKLMRSFETKKTDIIKAQYPFGDDDQVLACYESSPYISLFTQMKIQESERIFADIFRNQWEYQSTNQLKASDLQMFPDGNILLVFHSSQMEKDTLKTKNALIAGILIATGELRLEQNWKLNDNGTVTSSQISKKGEYVVFSLKESKEIKIVSGVKGELITKTKNQLGYFSQISISQSSDYIVGHDFNNIWLFLWKKNQLGEHQLVLLDWINKFEFGKSYFSSPEIHSVILSSEPEDKASKGYIVVAKKTGQLFKVSFR